MRKYSVLIVDDEENVSKLLTKVLDKRGYITYTAFNASEALSIIDSHQIDIAITDIRMPEISGIELLGRIKDIDSSIKVIMITAFATLETAVKALRMGARDYIIKPFNLDEVVEAVRKITENCKADECENDFLRNNCRVIENYLVTRSPSMIKVMELINQVADSRVTVMLYGETGTGKELAAQALHNLSSRKDKPLIKVNCAAIPESLLESELFGYEKGAFTGASNMKPGRFELANEGSIFLDEIGDLSPSTQVKLLRVLQEREFVRLGGIKNIKVDVRVIAATNKDLMDMVKKGLFREDLYYRLNVVPIKLPPLRERKEDIEVLIDQFLLKSSDISGRPPKKISHDAIEKLISYNWPGNIRELENIVERCVVITSDNTITLNDLPDYITNFNTIDSAEDNLNLHHNIDSTERDIIIKTLRDCGGNRTKASEVLGISRRSLHRKILKYNIED